MQSDTDQTILQAVIGMSSRLGGIEAGIEAVKETQREHTDTFFELTSWKNGIITMVTNEGEKRYQQAVTVAKSEIETALKPYKEDLERREKFTNGVKSKTWEIVWEWTKVGIIFSAGYLLTILTKI